MRNTFQIIVVIGAIFGLGLGAAFGSGAFWGRRNAPQPTTTPVAAAGSGAAAAGGGAAAAGGAGGAGGASAPTVGVVEDVTGDTVTIRTAAGGTVTVKIAADTTIRQLASATSADIRPGINVSVTGAPDATDGKVAART